MASSSVIVTRYQAIESSAVSKVSSNNNMVIFLYVCAFFGLDTNISFGCCLFSSIFSIAIGGGGTSVLLGVFVRECMWYCLLVFTLIFYTAHLSLVLPLSLPFSLRLQGGGGETSDLHNKLNSGASSCLRWPGSSVRLLWPTQWFLRYWQLSPQRCFYNFQITRSWYYFFYWFPGISSGQYHQ